MMTPKTVLLLLVAFLLAAHHVSCWCLSPLQQSTAAVKPSISTTALWLASPSANDNGQEAEEIKAKAEALRKEIDAFEKEKKEVELQEQRRVEQVLAAKQEARDRYSAFVPILKPDGSSQLEQCDFRPRWQDQSSFITVCEAPLPLGLILGESEEFVNAMVVDEVAPGTNGEAAGFQVGDLVHACTACKVEMEMPTWQIMAGGIGVPKTKRFMYLADGRPFEEVMEAIASNRQDPEERPVLIVVERKE